MPDPAGTGQTFTLDFAADPVAVRHALTQIMASPPVAALAVEDRATVEIVLAEVLNNIAEHAYATAGGRIVVRLARNPAGLGCHVTDWGCPMPGGQPPAGHLPRVAAPPPGGGVGDLPEGGFGWSLIRTLTTDLSYSRQAGRNELHVVIPLQG